MQQYLDKFLGKTVKDLTTGFTGIATGACLMCNGNIQITVSPKSDDPSAMKDQWSIDVHNLVVVDETPVVPSLAKVQTLIELEDKVKDRFSGKKGIVASLNYYLNGCVSAFVVGAKESNWVFIERLELVKKSNKPTPQVSTGCAPQRAVRM